jgi:large subunit ribosomal protein L21
VNIPSRMALHITEPNGSPDRRRPPGLPRENRCEVVYAVVRAGGRQEKVEVGTIVVLDRQKAKQGEKIELPAVLLVDGDTVTTDADTLAKVSVTAEVLGELRGPKIIIQKFKNKTGYKKRQGHRQDLTRVKVTGIK